MNTLSSSQFGSETRLSFFRSLRGKLILLFLAISLIPLIIVGLLAYTHAKTALKTEMINKLVAVRDIKAKRITDYFDERLLDLKIISKNLTIVAAINAFEEAIHAQRATLKTDDIGVMNHYRSLYLGKPDLVNAGDGSAYSAVHAHYHPIFKEYKEAYNYYDIFLVEPHSGAILYSVDKEEDFGSSLTSGPYAETSLGQVFQESVVITDHNVIRLEDFIYYEPSKEAASFVASPIFDGKELRGVLIFQLSTAQIDAIMQEHTGLGETGETLLVSSDDFLLRSNSRFVEETTLLKQKMDTKATRAAAAGETGVKTINCIGRTILVAYRPLNIYGVRWSLTAQIDDAEAFAAIQQLLIWMFSMICVGTLIVTTVAFFFSNSLAQPVQMMTNIARQLANGNLNLTVETKNQDEIGLMGQAFQHMIVNLRVVIEDIVSISQGLANGNLPVTPQAEYKGDFIKIKNTLETGLSNLRLVIKDIVQVSQGLAAGNLRVTPTEEYRGDFTMIKKALETALSDLLQVVEDIVQMSQGLAEGRQHTAKAEYRGDFTQIKNALETATAKLHEAMAQNAIQDWLKTGQTQLNQQISGEQDIITLAKNFITFLTTYLEAQVGVFYWLRTESQGQGLNGNEAADENARLKLIASYAYTQRKGIETEFKIGEGLIGQAALEKQRILVTEIPEDYICIQSGSGKAVPQQLLVIPCLYENAVKGVIEIGTFHEITEVQLEFLAQVMPNIGIAVNTAESRTKMQALLAQQITSPNSPQTFSFIKKE
jgi:HAMP domain-containing protein